MKHHPLILLAVALLFVSLAASTIPAASIDWEVKVLEGDLDISAEGSTVEAAYFNGPNATSASGQGPAPTSGELAELTSNEISMDLQVGQQAFIPLIHCSQYFAR